MANTCSGYSPFNSVFSPGTATGSVEIPYNNAPRQDIINSVDRAVSALGTGWKARITPGGGLNARESTNNHPNGYASDVQLFYQGKLVTPTDNPGLYQTFASNLTADAASRGVTAGIGGYDSFLHYDESPWRAGQGAAMPWGASGSKDTAPQWLKDGISQGANATVAPPNTNPDGTSGLPPKPGEDQMAASEAAKTSTVNCTPTGGGAGSGGCSPVSAGVVGIAASLMGGAGLSIPGPLGAAVNAIKNGPAGLASAALSTAAGAVTAAVPGLDTITKGVSDAIKTIGGSNPFSSIMGNLPIGASQAMGILRNPVGAIASNFSGNIPFLGNVVDSVATNLLGNTRQFTAAFNLAQGAVGSAVGLGRGLDQLTNRLFGSAPSLLAAQGNYLLGGYTNMNIENMTGSLTKRLIGPLSETLPNLVADNQMAPFGSIYRDYNSMITQGFGSITSNLDALGRDLSELGYLADMRDTFRIGTPGQIVSQIILMGAGYDTGILQSLNAIGLSARDVNSFESDEIAYDVLSSITDEAQIDAALIALEIENREGLANLGELCDPEFLLPRSYESNEFLELNEIAPQLIMCGLGEITTLRDLGRLFLSMETLYDATDLNSLPQPTTLSEIDSMRTTLSPTGVYSGNGDLTVADLLGTAAGYGHTQNLPRILELQQQIWDDPITADLRDMIQVLQDTLDGVYTDTMLMQIDVPATGSYAGGTYYTLDDAASDIQTAIEAELDTIGENATGETAMALEELQGLHNESVNQLYREHYLRQQYGIKLGATGQNVEFFRGDGSTTTFTILGSIEPGSSVDVYVNSNWRSKDAFTVNTSTGVLTFDTAPAAGQTIEVIYNDGTIPLSSNANDIWNFASNIEQYARNTGFGRESDFLNRIVTDDMHGQRIKAVMIQARNKDRAESFGITCTGENRILSDFSERGTALQGFTERTGIWSEDPSRASEIWLQLQDPESTSRDVYYQRRLASTADMMQDNKDRALREILDSLLFVAGDQMIITDLGVLAYDTVDPERGTYNLDLLNAQPQREGFVLGPTVELITAMLDVEKLKDAQDQYLTDPSANTRAYLSKIGIDISRLVAVLQMTLLSETANTFGLNLSDSRMIFGVPSVSKLLLMNLSMVD